MFPSIHITQFATFNRDKSRLKDWDKCLEVIFYSVKNGQSIGSRLDGFGIPAPCQCLRIIYSWPDFSLRQVS